MKPLTTPYPDIHPMTSPQNGPDTLAALQVNPDTGLTRAEVEARRKVHSFNEAAEKKGHPALKFFGKFRGISAWMLELIMFLSAVLRKFADLAVVSALLVVNAVLSFMQERRAAGVFDLATNDNALYTFSFLTLLYFAVFSIVSARERRWFWTTMPSKTLVAALMADALTGSALTFAGLPGLAPLPGWQMLVIFFYAMISCLAVNDSAKVAMTKWRVSKAVSTVSGRS